ncbi:MAG: hypothetical protein P1V51_05545 [Deltaproteobacteria bacterium]|nr:hypothetical protein [Deltaproteobacteria bacterium]
MTGTPQRWSGLAASFLSLLLLGSLACGGEAPRVRVDVSPAVIDADGRSTARVTVNLEGYEGSVLLSTSRGTFQDSGAERFPTTMSAGQAVAVLVACDEALDPDCPGNASVVADCEGEIGFGIATFASTNP